MYFNHSHAIVLHTIPQAQDEHTQSTLPVVLVDNIRQHEHVVSLPAAESHQQPCNGLVRLKRQLRAWKVSCFHMSCYRVKIRFHVFV